MGNAIRHNLAIRLPPRHNRQLRFQRSNRPLPHPHPNLVPPIRHLKMEFLLQQRLIPFSPLIRTAPQKGDTFKFSTFGFPVLTCTVEESVFPEGGKAGRIAWSAKLENGEESVSVYHAWLVEDLEGGRVRILTQESQSGKPAKELAGVKPN